MKILSRPKGNAEEYGRWAVNAYLGCPNQCQYCYLKKGPGAKNLGGSEARLKAHIVNAEHAYHIAMTEIIENREQIRRDGGLFFTFTSDPCLPETRHLTFTIAHEAIAMGIPVTILTKSHVAGPLYRHVATGREMQLPLPHEDPSARLLAFGCTLTGYDELERRAPGNQHRIGDMHGFFSAGYKTWASIEPVIDFNASAKMIQRALSAGCQHFKIGLMTKNTKVCRKGFSLGGHDFAPYDPAECLAFVQDVMTLTRDRATVYWKQSFREFIGGTPAHRLFKDDELRRIFDDYPNAVDAKWNMFDDE